MDWEKWVSHPRVIFEAGVGRLPTCRSRSHWDTARCILCEPVPRLYEEIAEAAKPYSKVTVHNLAIYPEDREVVFMRMAGASHIEDLNSPRVQFGDRHYGQFIATGRRIEHFDDGEIDVMLLDMEGAEWYALKNLRSRPKLIVVETHFVAKPYTNPHEKEILDWMSENHYVAVDTNRSDTFFLKSSPLFL